MKNITLSLLVVIIISSAADGANETPPARFRLSYVSFRGVENVNRGKLENQLVTKMPSRWKFWLPGPLLTKEDLEDDRIRIRLYYRKNGFYHTKVTVHTEVNRQESRQPDLNEDRQDDTRLPLVRVIFEIDEGEPVVVSTIELPNPPHIDEGPRDALFDILPLKKGQVFNVDDYEAAKARMRRYWADHGYPFAEVSGKATIDTVANRADVRIDIDSGTLCRFGPVTIDQSQNPVAGETIRRGLVFQENEIYDQSKIEKSRENLIQLNVFRLVIFEPQGPPEKDGDPVPLRLELQSKKRHSLQAGIGYGSEDKLRLQGAWTYRNVFGYAGNSTLWAKYSDLIESLHFDFNQPYIWDDRTTLYASSGYEKEKFPSYTNRKILAQLGIRRTADYDLTGNIGYRLEYNNVENIDLVAFNSEDPEDFEEQNQYLVSAAFTQLVRDTRNNRLNPNQGSLLSGSVEWASRLLGSELQYIRPSLEARIYYPFLEKLVGSARMRLETIQETETSEFIPINKRLFLGGSNTVRGYGFQEVPPLDAAGNPVGGRSALNTNIEMRFPIYGAFAGVIFLDAGLIDPEPFSLTLSDTWYSCGTGIRYNTIIGPLRVDFGYKINPPTGEDIGDSRNPDEIVGDRWRLHFSIGQTF